MSRAYDAWYVRFPDGRVMRANSTAAVRHHLEGGRIPSESRVRRSPEEEWAALDWTPEFADLAPKRPVRSAGARLASAPDTGAAAAETAAADLRHSGLQLQTVGVRGLADELLAAMDSALMRGKLVIAGLAGLLGGLVCVVAALTATVAPWPWLPWVGGGLVLLLIGAFCSTLLTQMTFVEMSRLRPARWTETTAGLGRHALRLLLAQFLVGGTVVAAIVALRWLPSWLLSPNRPEALAGADVVAGGVTAVALVLQVLLWPVLGFALLLAPLLLIEEYTAGQALGQWWGLLRRHGSRIFLYEALAVALAGVAALPFAFPVALAAGSAPTTGLAGMIGEATLILLTGLALTPLIAYLIVANVFIYLNLRYEHTPLSR